MDTRTQSRFRGYCKCPTDMRDSRAVNLQRPEREKTCGVLLLHEYSEAKLLAAHNGLKP